MQQIYKWRLDCSWLTFEGYLGLVIIYLRFALPFERIHHFNMLKIHFGCTGCPKKVNHIFFNLDHLYLVDPPPPTALMNSPVIISDEKIFIIDFFWDTLYLWSPFSWLVVWRNFRIVNWTESKANNLLSCRICSKPVLWSIFPIHKPPTRKWQIWGRTGHTFWQLLWWWIECCYMVNTQVPNLGFW